MLIIRWVATFLVISSTGCVLTSKPKPMSYQAYQVAMREGDSCAIARYLKQEIDISANGWAVSEGEMEDVRYYQKACKEDLINQSHQNRHASKPKLTWADCYSPGMTFTQAAAAADRGDCNYFKKSKDLHLYGGQGHSDYLGCLTCSSTSKDSICNDIGKYGNGLQSKSIWNYYGKYGSSYKVTSPWNSSSTGSAPPAIVDMQGNFYGYFTLNTMHPKAFKQANRFKSLYEATGGDLRRFKQELCRGK